MSAFGGRAQGQRYGTLRAETDALRRGFLPRPDADRLRKHVDSDGFVSDFDLAIAAQAKQVFQSIPSWWSKRNTVSQAGEAQVGREIPLVMDSLWVPHLSRSLRQVENGPA